jgi:hypothetical protein
MSLAAEYDEPDSKQGTVEATPYLGTVHVGVFPAIKEVACSMNVSGPKHLVDTPDKNISSLAPKIDKSHFQISAILYFVGFRVGSGI